MGLLCYFCYSNYFIWIYFWFGKYLCGIFSFIYKESIEFYEVFLLFLKIKDLGLVMFLFFLLFSLLKVECYIKILFLGYF